MLTAKCIQKFRKSNGQILGYRLQDQQGKTIDVTPDQLKQAISQNKIHIINLTLTSDNRLIDTTPTQQKVTKTQKISEEKIKNLIVKAKLLGLQVKEIPTYCEHKCILISQSDTQHTVYIPDDVTRLNRYWSELVFTDHIKYLQGTIKIIGGGNLKDVNHMFYKCQATSLDLTSFNTSKVTNMVFMFFRCQATSLDLSSFNTSKVTDMNHMFAECEATSLDLSSFDTSNVTSMSWMFDNCQTTSLDLSSFNTSKVTSMVCMFRGCAATSLNLSSFNTSNVTDIENMFWQCEAQIKATDPRILKAYNR